ncbi:hypothetical protein [Rubrivirga sp.]|uniref:BP74-related protein n=1 Tax=Rubrivirga sp. TaxID=1885344 RepID=UPI003C782498
MIRSSLFIACSLVALAACDSSDPIALAVYEVEVATLDGPERFRLGLDTEAQVDHAEAALAAGRVGVVHGTVVRGDGGFNDSYSWHLDPASVTFPDLAIEVCDGRPRSDVEADLDYWAETIGVYCPWGARLLSRAE